MNAKESFQTKVGEDNLATVYYTYIPGSRGARDSLGGRRGAGPPLEPDEPAYCEVDEVVCDNGTKLRLDELSENEFNRIVSLAEDDYAAKHSRD